MSILKKILINVTGNGLIQKALEYNVLISQYLMGIGSGGGVSYSGEETIFEELRKKVAPPYCVFDVGSNKGQFLQLAINNISTNDFTIHCFEPGKETFKILSKSSPKNSQIFLNNIGIGKEKSEAVLHYNEVGSGIASLTKRRLDHFGIDFEEQEEIKINTIDNYCSDNKINHIHLLKIDIEGHELDALVGAKRMFDSKAIDIVTFEFGGCNIDTRTFFQDFWYFFSENKFKLYRITPSGYLHPLKSYKEIHEQFRTINFMAVANCYRNREESHDSPLPQHAAYGSVLRGSADSRQGRVQGNKRRSDEK